MKNYVVTFTNNAIPEDLYSQTQSLRESLGRNSTYISQLNEEISYEAIDREVENALLNDFDNFICLAENEDVDMLQEGLDAEYGNRFNEILVIPEAFGRLYEADPVMTDNPENAQVTQSTSVYDSEDFKNFLANSKFSNLVSQVYGLAKRKGAVAIPPTSLDSLVREAKSKDLSSLSIDEITRVVKLLLIGTIAAAGASSNSPLVISGVESYSNFRNLSGIPLQNSILRVSPSGNIDPNSAKVFLANKYLVLYRKGKNITSNDEVISVNEETVISKAKAFLIYIVSTNYPFVDVMTELSKDISAKISKYSSKGLELKYMMCGPTPNQQFLPSTSILEIAKKIPEANLENILKSTKMGEGGTLHSGYLVEEQIATSLQTLSTIAPNAQEVVLVFPKGFKPHTLVAGAKIKCLNGNVLSIMGIEEGIQQWNVSRNQPVFKCLNELLSTENNQYKGCKTNSKIKKQEMHVEDDLDDEVEVEEGEDIKDVKVKETGNKELLSKSMKATRDEVATGWPAFVKALMSATEEYLKEKLEKTSTPDQYAKKVGHVKQMFIDGAKLDAAEFKKAFDAIGVGDLMQAVAQNIADKFKKKKEDYKDLRKVLALISTEDYQYIKEAFGGKFDAEAFIIPEDEDIED